MENSKVYVISVMQRRDYEEDYVWIYAALDSYAELIGNNYPTWSNSEAHACKFSTMEEAEEWWNSNKDYLYKIMLITNASIIQDTLGIRERTYMLSEKLKF